MPSVDLISGDRRADQRYSFEMPLRFWWRCGEDRRTGWGHTGNLARKSLLMVTDTPPEVGVEVEICVEWPFRLQEVCELELWVWGVVVMNHEGGSAVRINDHEFRTCGAQSFGQAAAPEVTWSIVA
jgi:hypothetical protein